MSSNLKKQANKGTKCDADVTILFHITQLSHGGFGLHEFLSCRGIAAMFLVCRYGMTGRQVCTLLLRVRLLLCSLADFKYFKSVSKTIAVAYITILRV